MGQEDKGLWTERYQPLPEFNLVLNFFVNIIFICYCCSQVLEISHIFEGLIGNHYNIILAYILMDITIYFVFSVYVYTNLPSSI